MKLSANEVLLIPHLQVRCPELLDGKVFTGVSTDSRSVAPGVNEHDFLRLRAGGRGHRGRRGERETQEQNAADPDGHGGNSAFRAKSLTDSRWIGDAGPMPNTYARALNSRKSIETAPIAS